jgi:hypothetical protein
MREKQMPRLCQCRKSTARECSLIKIGCGPSPPQGWRHIPRFIGRVSGVKRYLIAQGCWKSINIKIAPLQLSWSGVQFASTTGWFRQEQITKLSPEGPVAFVVESWRWKWHVGTEMLDLKWYLFKVLWWQRDWLTLKFIWYGPFRTGINNHVRHGNNSPTPREYSLVQCPEDPSRPWGYKTQDLYLNWLE